MSEQLSAIHQAKLLHQYAGIEEPFEQVLCDYMDHGFVAVQPRTFAMAKVMRSKVESPTMFDDLEQADDGNIWFIHWGIGNLKPLFALLPFELDWIAFCRRWKKELKLYPFDKFKLKVMS